MGYIETKTGYSRYGSAFNSYQISNINNDLNYDENNQNHWKTLEDYCNRTVTRSNTAAGNPEQQRVNRNYQTKKIL